ncbi:MAG: hypothetical protein U0174_06165 [Polyangiaceae bacterium]
MRNSALWSSLTALLLATACARPTAEPSGQSQPQTSTSPLTNATLKWPAVGSEDKVLQKSLLLEDRAAIDKTPMPVLWPSAPGVTRVAYIGQDAFYSIAATSVAEVPSGKSTATITVQGTRKLIEHENMPKGGISNRTFRGAPTFYTVNEGIVSATWFEYGVSYSVDVECSNRDDSRCGSDAYLQELVESLRFVGGQR